MIIYLIFSLTKLSAGLSISDYYDAIETKATIYGN